MTAPDGPYLYDDAPEPLHTGTPRRRNWSILVILAATVLVAVGSVIARPLLTGSAGQQSGQAVGVFLAALDQGDTETAYELLCDAERARLTPGQVSDAYRPGGGGRVVSSADATVGGKPVERVTVRW